jgi:uncharacterized protein (TIGR03437 family)
MKRFTQNITLVPFALALFSPILSANSGANAAAPAPPLKRTGAMIDGGLNCTACHAGTVNSGPGSVAIRTAAYRPGVRQMIEVMITDPDAARWGFQLTARLASDETKQAGTFGQSANVLVRCDDGAVRGAPAPCATGQLQFASHTAAGTTASLASPRTFQIEWQPPSSDLGPVTLYVAANAANNSGNNQGDRIYTSSMRVASTGCTLTGPPIVTGVGSAATGAVASISPNGLISIFGTGLFAGTNLLSASGSDLTAEGRWPTSLGCVAVEVGGRRAPVFFVSSGQINAQVPFVDNGAAVPVRVILNPGATGELRSPDLNARVNPNAPAFLTFNSTSIAATTLAGGIIADAAVVPGGVAAKPGDTVVLYGVGFGFTNPVFQPGEYANQAAPLRDAFTVSVGGTALAAGNVLYGGLSGGAPGLYQFNIKLPDTLADGNIPVSVTVNGVATQAGTTIPVKK